MNKTQAGTEGQIKQTDYDTQCEWLIFHKVNKKIKVGSREG